MPPESLYFTSKSFNNFVVVFALRLSTACAFDFDTDTVSSQRYKCYV